MCDRDGSRAAPSGIPQSPAEATAMVLAGLNWLASAELGSVPASVQAECLRGLEQAASAQVAARSVVLSAFEAQGGFQDDGHGTARTWLRWQTRITDTAASAAVGWMRRLNAHRAVRDALRAGTVSVSWARHICDWTDLLPPSARDDADLILLAAAEGGAELADLASLAEQMRRRLCPADGDGKPGFEDRQVRLRTTIGGAGRLEGDLTSNCAEAVQAVLDALGKKAGPEDTRTVRQRHHDALEEACRRLIGAGMVPDRAGQATQIQLHTSLSDLLRRTNEAGTGTGNDAGTGTEPTPGSWWQGAGWADRLWPRLTPDGSASDGSDTDRSDLPESALPGPAARPGDECDATIIPMVTGHVDHDLLDRLTNLLTRPHSETGSADSGICAECGAWSGTLTRDQVRRHVRDLILDNAVALLSGPHGLASYLRTGKLAPPAGSVSLPLDVGKPTDTIPPHLRRAVIARDKHCAAPGCLQPPSACQVHHIIPKAQGGTTKLTNLLLLCAFHHLILVHTWGWTITLKPDGTTSMTSPDGDRVYHSHSPPSAAA